MNLPRSVALVGKPNVGKSRLFNRLAGRRIAIVHDQPGVTRDLNVVDVEGDFSLMDTGGLGLDSVHQGENLGEIIAEQVFFAVQAAGIILMVVDGADGCSAVDESILADLRRYGKEPLLVINKIDQPEHEERISEFDHLGLKHAFSVSAEHGRGIKGLNGEIRRMLGPKPRDEDSDGLEEPERVKICFIGRPNVGKSSLCNRLLSADRLIVHEVPGTTRDSVEIDLDYTTENGENGSFRLIDTAGVRRRAGTRTPVEYFSSLRSRDAVQRADVVFLVLDARAGVTRQDKLLAGQAMDAGKALAVVVNKWDLVHDWFRRDPPAEYDDEREFRAKFLEAVAKEVFFMSGCPILFTSALEGLRLEKILSMATELDEKQMTRIPTPRLNRLINSLLRKRRPRQQKGRRLKIYYSVQTGIRPIRIRLFCNQATKLEGPYRRYLEHSIIRKYNLQGCPITFDVVGKSARVKSFYTPQEKWSRDP